MMYYMNNNMTVFHSFAMLVFWGVIIFVLFFIYKSNKLLKKESSIAILKKRLASGEIKKEEFEDIKNSLSDI